MTGASPKIVFYGAPVTPFADAFMRQAPAHLNVVTVEYEDPIDHVTQLLKSADVLITNRFRKMPGTYPRLKLIQCPGAGLDEIDLSAVPDNVRVCNVYEHEGGAAEYVILAMLERCWDLAGADQELRKGNWRRSSRFGGAPVSELAEKTLGIVGFGHIGQEVAKRAHCLGMRVLAASRRKPQHPALSASYAISDLEVMLQACHFVVISCALTDATVGLIGATEFKAMRRDAFLINISRGPIVDEEALFLALERDQIGGAQIDVWYRYPEPDDENQSPSKFNFGALSNVHMTPHIAGWTESTVRKRWEAISRNVLAVLNGDPLHNIVR